jgi:hypothetical protein
LEKKRQLFNELLEQNEAPKRLGLSEEEIFGLFNIKNKRRLAARRIAVETLCCPRGTRVRESLHGIPLAVQNVVRLFREGFLRPQVTCAAVAGPARPIHLGRESLVQATAGGSLEVVHDTLRRPRCRHNNVGMVRANVDCMQYPTLLAGNLAQGVQRDLSVRLVKGIARFGKVAPFTRAALGIRR